MPALYHKIYSTIVLVKKLPLNILLLVILLVLVASLITLITLTKPQTTSPTPISSPANTFTFNFRSYPHPITITTQKNQDSSLVYNQQTDTYSDLSPSSQFSWKIANQIEVNKLLTTTNITDDSGTLLTNEGQLGNTQINNLKFTTLRRTQVANLLNDQGEKYTTLAHDYTDCLYPLNSNTYLSYSVTLGQIGSEVDLCKVLENLGISSISFPVANTTTFSIYDWIDQGIVLSHEPTFKIRPEKNKVTLYDEFGNEQSLEIFSKNPQVNLKTAILNVFPKQFNPVNCELTMSDKTDHQTGIIRMKKPLVEDESWADPSDQGCPPSPYTETDGATYFALFPQKPNKLFFFKLGQFAIGGTSGFWQNSLSFYTPNQFTGTWTHTIKNQIPGSDDKNYTRVDTASITLYQQGQNAIGTHYIANDNGNRMDESVGFSIFGKINNVGNLDFTIYSGRDNTKASGTAQLNSQVLALKITDPADITNYADSLLYVLDGDLPKDTSLRTKDYPLPIYSNSSFTNLTNENGITYSWSTPDSLDQVISFFETDPRKTGWKLIGGAGAYAIDQFGTLEHTPKLPKSINPDVYFINLSANPSTNQTDISIRSVY